MIDTPLQRYCYQMDINCLNRRLKEGNPMYLDRDYYYSMAIQTQPEHWNKLLLEEYKFRANNKMNVVFSAYGGQGSGKSLSMLENCSILGEVFNVPFTVDNVVFDVMDFNARIKERKARETYFLDEQNLGNIGIMSRSNLLFLADYEDQLRITQNNFGYASPELRDHSHFFIFETYGIKRDSKGVPDLFYSLLWTKRHIDQCFVPRGIVSFKSIIKSNPEFYEQYQKKKMEHIEHLEKKDLSTLNEMDKDINEILEGHLKEIVWLSEKGFKVVNKGVLYKNVSQWIGTAGYSTKAFDILIANIIDKANKKIVLLNEELRQKKEKEKLELLEKKRIEDEKQKYTDEFNRKYDVNYSYEQIISFEKSLAEKEKQKT